jgi:hypothetical protein
MKKTFKYEQIVGILHGFEPSGKTIKEYCREKDVSVGTFYKWGNRFGVNNREWFCLAFGAFRKQTNKLLPFDNFITLNLPSYDW